MDFIIRRYVKADNKSVKKLHKNALQVIDAWIDGKWDEDLDDIENIYLKDGEFLIGLLDNKIIAMGAIKRVSDDICELKRMRVYPDHQGKGYGSIILKELEIRAKELNFKTIQLDTTVKQPAAIHLYEKNNYQETGRKIKGPPFETIYFKKDLI